MINKEFVMKKFRATITALNNSRLFLIMLLISVIPAIIVLAIPENRVDLSIMEFFKSFTFGFLLIFGLLEWLVKGVISILQAIPSFVFSEWRYAFLIAGIFGTLIYSDYNLRKNERLRRIADWEASKSRRELESKIDQESSLDNTEELPPDEDSTDLNSLTVLELFDKKTALYNSISVAEDEIDDIWAELEAREANEAWLQENGFNPVSDNKDQEKY